MRAILMVTKSLTSGKHPNYVNPLRVTVAALVKAVAGGEVRPCPVIKVPTTTFHESRQYRTLAVSKREHPSNAPFSIYLGF